MNEKPSCPVLRLMPRLKNIYEQKLYLVDKTDEEHYPHLPLILERAINWELIRQQYDQMVKYATASRQRRPRKTSFSPST